MSSETWSRGKTAEMILLYPHLNKYFNSWSSHVPREGGQFPAHYSSWNPLSRVPRAVGAVTGAEKNQDSPFRKGVSIGNNTVFHTLALSEKFILKWYRGDHHTILKSNNKTRKKKANTQTLEYKPEVRIPNSSNGIKRVSSFWHWRLWVESFLRPFYLENSIIFSSIAMCVSFLRRKISLTNRK